VGVAGAAVLVGVAGGVAVGEGVAGTAVGDDVGLGDAVGMMLGLGGLLSVGRGVGVEDASGGAHVSASDAATARWSGALSARRRKCSPLETERASSGR
jgi:hypothetical protein